MSVQVPAGLLQELVDALKANAEASREAVRLARRSEPGEGGGGFTAAQLRSGLGAAAAVSYGAANLAGGPVTQEGAVATIAGGALAGAAVGAAMGSAVVPGYGTAVGAVAGAAVGAASGAVSVLGANETMEAAEARLSDPSLDQVSRELAQKRLDMTRDGEFSAAAKIERYFTGEAGPEEALERERIERAPQARATARLAEEAAALGRYGYEMDEAQAAIRLGQYEEQERGADAGRRLVNKVAAAKWSDRAGLAD